MPLAVVDGLAAALVHLRGDSAANKITSFNRLFLGLLSAYNSLSDELRISAYYISFKHIP